MREEMYRTLKERIDKLEQENKELRAMIEEQIYHFMYMFRKKGHHGMHIITKDHRKQFLEDYFGSQLTIIDEEFICKILLSLKIPIKLHPIWGEGKEYLEMSDLKPENARLISESIHYYSGDYHSIIAEKIKELDNKTCEILYIIVLEQYFKESIIDGYIDEELEDILKKLKNELKSIEERDKYFRTEIPFISKQEYLPTFFNN